MRILSGEFKGRKIFTPEGIRPVSERVRKSCFDILGDQVKGKRVLDLFSGSGSLGFEAISRGAEFCVFIDANRKGISAVRRNISALALSAKTQSYLKDSFLAVKDFFAAKTTFDLIFLDPPYAKGFVERTIQEISTGKILSENGRIIAEHDVKEAVRSPIGGFIMDRQEKYGLTLLSFFGNQ